MPDFSGARAALAGQSGGARAVTTVTYVVPDDETNAMCSGPMASDITWMTHVATTVALDESSLYYVGGSSGGGRACAATPTRAAPLGLLCAAYGNMNNGMTNFDNILYAWLAIFQTITQVCSKSTLDWFEPQPL